MAYSVRDDIIPPHFFKSYNDFSADIDLSTEGPSDNPGQLPCMIWIDVTAAGDLVMTDDHGNTATIRLDTGNVGPIRCAPKIIESATAFTGDIVVFWENNS